MVIEGLKRKLCRDVLVDADVVAGRSVVVTSFSYPNGDSIDIFFRSMGDTIAASDEGATLSFFKTQGVELPPDRRELIKTICRSFDVEFTTPEIRKQFQLSDIGPACLSLCEAITNVASIYYHVDTPVRSSLPVAINKLLRARVEPKRGVDRQWTSRRHDPKGSFPVDFRMNGIGDPRNIFAVTSPSKSIMTVAVMNFLKSHRIPGHSLAVIDPDAEIGPRDTNRLELTADKIIYGITGKENTIVRFALQTAD